MPLVAQVIDQTTRRVFQHEQVPAGEKIVSLFEPHTAIIKRGKAHPHETEFGRNVWYCESDGGILTDYRLLVGNPPESEYWLPSLKHHRHFLGRVPEVATADRGVYSSKNEQAAKEVLEKIGEDNGIIVQADVSKEDDVKRLVGEAIKRFGKIDVLVNNAGIVFDIPLMEKTVEQWGNAATIQGEMESALHKLTGEQTRVSMASRTDAGVHAKGQVVGFKTRAPFPPKTWVDAMNHYLPEDISVRAAYEVDECFDVRRHASSREYRYHIMNRRTPSPLWRLFSESVPQPLDVEAMNTACTVLVGERDFAPFAPATYSRSTQRRTLRAEVSRKRNLVLFDMEATSFLPHQVRNTVGGLVKVGLHKTSVESFREKACSGKAGTIGPTAPARGFVHF